MATGHPVDHDGRALPESSWPPDRQAPGPLELVRRFCNTTNLESGADRLESAAGFTSWLDEQDRSGFVSGPADRARCIQVREALRDACTAHRERGDDAEALRRMTQFTNGVGFQLSPDLTTFELNVSPGQPDADRFIGELVLAVLAARSSGTWERLKACRSCRWVIYDGSKNQSAQWCSMSACGGRSKVRAHRARLSEDARTQR